MQMFPRHVFLRHQQSPRWPSLPGDAPAARAMWTVGFFFVLSLGPGTWGRSGAVFTFDRDNDGNVKDLPESDFGSVFGERKIESTDPSL